MIDSSGLHCKMTALINGAFLCNTYPCQQQQLICVHGDEDKSKLRCCSILFWWLGFDIVGLIKRQG